LGLYSSGFSDVPGHLGGPYAVFGNFGVRLFRCIRCIRPRTSCTSQFPLCASLATSCALPSLRELVVADMLLRRFGEFFRAFLIRSFVSPIHCECSEKGVVTAFDRILGLFRRASCHDCWSPRGPLRPAPALVSALALSRMCRRI